jgi:hypothetical protein
VELAHTLIVRGLGLLSSHADHGAIDVKAYIWKLLTNLADVLQVDFSKSYL